MSQTTFTPNRRIRVLVVDSSVVIRRAFAEAYASDDSIEIASSAPDGEVALIKVSQVNPDTILLDTELLQKGLSCLEQLHQRYPELPVILLGHDDNDGSELLQAATKLGVRDSLAKPKGAGVNKGFFDAVKAKVRKLFASAETAGIRPATLQPGGKSSYVGKKIHRRIVVIGVSTGGPDALKVVLRAFPRNFSLPIVIVQHMLPAFTPYLVQQLRSHCHLAIEEAHEGSSLAPGKILIAPGDFHVKCTGTATKPQIVLDQSMPENSCRPAVDPLFRTAAATFGAACIGVILTGMGRDGLLGAHALKSAGAYVIAQDEHSSVVWGMPGQVVKAGLADTVAGLDEIVPAILKQV